jgi:hypothetical protein
MNKSSELALLNGRNLYNLHNLHIDPNIQIINHQNQNVKNDKMQYNFILHS